MTRRIGCLLRGHEWHGLFEPTLTCAKCGKQRPNTLTARTTKNGDNNE